MKPMLALALGMLPVTAFAQSPSCAITNFGIFQRVTPYETREAPGTASGSEVLAHPRALVERTDRVPGKLGVLFGVVHKFSNVPRDGIVAAVVRHPPLSAKAGGKKVESVLRKDPESAATGFRFDRPEEIVLGEWTFEFQYEGNVLCRKTFRVEASN